LTFPGSPVHPYRDPLAHTPPAVLGRRVTALAPLALATTFRTRSRSVTIAPRDHDAAGAQLTESHEFTSCSCRPAPDQEVFTLMCFSPFFALSFTS
jgi:hypothetical protein